MSFAKKLANCFKSDKCEATKPVNGVYEKLNISELLEIEVPDGRVFNNLDIICDVDVDPLANALGDVEKFIFKIKPVNLTNLIVDLMNCSSFSEAFAYLGAFVELYEISVTKFVKKLIKMLYFGFVLIKDNIKCFLNPDLIVAQSFDFEPSGIYAQLIDYLCGLGLSKESLNNMTPFAVSIITSAVTFVGLTYTAFNSGFKGFDARFLSAVNWGFLAFERIPETFGKIVSMLTTAIYKILGVTIHPEIPIAVRPMHARMVALDAEFIRLQEICSASPAKFIVESDLALKLTSATSEYRSLSVEMPKLPREHQPAMLFMMTRLTNAYNLLTKSITELRLSLGIKMVPVVIYIYGAAGAGKSSFTAQLRTRLAARDSSYASCFSRGMEEFWSGYVGQTVCVYDDLGALRDGSDLTEMMSIHSENAYPVPMADLGEKGRVFSSEIVIVNSNVAYYSDQSAADQKLNHPSIMNRRRDIFIEIAPHAHLAKLVQTHGCIDTYEFLDKDTPVEDAWRIVELNNLPTDNVDNVKCVRTMTDLVDQIIDLHASRRRRFAQAIDGIRSNFASTVLADDIVDVLDNKTMPLTREPTYYTPEVSESESDEEILKFFRSTPKLTQQKKNHKGGGFRHFGDIFAESAPMVCTKARQAPIYLLVGPPGIGKTSVLKNVAGCSKVTFNDFHNANLNKKRILFDDITLNQDYFNQIIPFITSCCDNDDVEQIFVTANVLFNKFLDAYDPELADAFERRVQFKYVFTYAKRYLTTFNRTDIAACDGDISYNKMVNIRRYVPTASGTASASVALCVILQDINSYKVEPPKCVFYDIPEVPPSAAVGVCEVVLPVNLCDIGTLDTLTLMKLGAKVVYSGLGSAVKKLIVAIQNLGIDSVDPDVMMKAVNSSNMKVHRTFEMVVRCNDVAIYASTLGDRVVLAKIVDNVSYRVNATTVYKYIDDLLVDEWQSTPMDVYFDKFASSRTGTPNFSSTPFVPIEVPTSIIREWLVKCAERTSFGNLVYVVTTLARASPVLFSMYTLWNKFRPADGKVVKESWASDCESDSDEFVSLDTMRSRLGLDRNEMYVVDKLNKRVGRYVYDPVLRKWVFKVFAESKRIKILCDGVFDLCHPGHVNLFATLKHDYPDCELWAGVVSDNDVIDHKGKNPVFPFVQRVQMLEANKYVDKVLHDPVPWDITVDFLIEHDFDYLAHDAHAYPAVYEPFIKEDRFIQVDPVGKHSSDYVLHESYEIPKFGSKRNQPKKTLTKKPGKVRVEALKPKILFDQSIVADKDLSKPSDLESVIPTAEGCADPTAMSLIPKVVANVISLTDNRGNHVNHGLMLVGLIGVTVKHSIALRDHLYFNGKPIRDTSLVANRDVGFFRLDPTHQTLFKDITHLLVDTEVCDDYSNMQAMFFQKIADLICWQSVILKSNLGIKYEPFNSDVNAVQYVSSITDYQFKTSIQTMAGDCGGPILLCNTRFSKKLVGIHSAASVGAGYIAPVFYGDYIKYLGTIRPQCGGKIIKGECILPQDSEPNDEPPIRFYATQFFGTTQPRNEGKLRVVGTLLDSSNFIRNNYESNKTALVPAPYSVYEAYDEPYQPAAQSTFDLRIPESIRFSSTTVKEMMLADFYGDEVVEAFDEEILSIVIMDIGGFFSDLISKEGLEPRVLSNLEAINGNIKIPCSSGLTMTSSPGYPFDNYAHTKAAFFRFDDRNNIYRYDTKTVHGKLLASNVVKIIDAAKHGKRSGVVFKISTKDELRKKEKIYDDLKTRIIAGAPLDYVIAIRKYCYDVQCALTEVHERSPIKIGINATGIDWHRNIVRHLKVSDKGFDADYRKWDTTIPVRLMKAADELYCRIYETCGSSKDIDKDNRIRMALGACLQKPFFGTGDKIVQVEQGMVSGCPDTTMRNCFINYILFYYTYRVLAQESLHASLIDFSSFTKNVCVSIYGDDNFCTISPLVDKWFNYHTYANVVKRFGFNITPADKSDNVTGLKKITQMEFLKRNIVKDDELGIYVGPLVKASIDKMLCYTRSTTYDLYQVQLGDKEPPAPDLNTLKQTIEAAIRESCLHSKIFYDAMVLRLRRVANDFDLDINFSDYSDLKRIVLFET